METKLLTTTNLICRRNQMIISDLEHLEAVSELTGILGGKNDKIKTPKYSKKTPIINITIENNVTAQAIAQAQATATTSTGTTPTAP